MRKTLIFAVFWGCLQPLLFGQIPSTTSVPTGGIRVQPYPAQIFYDAFNLAAFDNIIRWNTAVAGGTGSTTYSQGNMAISPGATANSFAYIKTRVNFQPVSPGYLELNIQGGYNAFPVNSNIYYFIGFGNPSGSPTSSAYCTDCIGFEIVNNSLSPVAWASGVRNTINFPPTPGNNNPGVSSNLTNVVDTANHKWVVEFQGDSAFWLIDGKVVGQMLTGAPGPNNNVLPVVILAGQGPQTPTTNQPFNIAAVYVGDGTNSFIRSIDPCLANRKINVPFALSASAQVVTGLAGENVYLCGLAISNSSSSNPANAVVVEGTGTTCATGIAGVIGGTTAATGLGLPATAGNFTFGSGAGTIASTATAGDNVCILISGTTPQVDGSLMYTLQ